MAFNTTYKPLFEIELLHDYFLNDGATAFSTLSDADKKKRLSLLDISEFIEVVPSQNTIQKMAGHKIVFKTRKTGLSAYCKVANASQNTPFIPLPSDLALTFIMKIADPFFGNYTDLTTSSPNIFFFGNTKPSTEGGGFQFIAKSTDNTQITDAYQLSTAGTTAQLKKLKSPNTIGVYGIIELAMTGDASDLSILTTLGDLRSQLPTFKIHFKNRETFWRYKRVSDDSEIFTTATVNPLTKYGFIEVVHAGDKFPNPSANHLIPDNNNFFSEIYI
ncbi:hypothetical protein [Hwangdonia lutea]|uniref:Uncharacterized protein n=1 Tax=Hwangdonia lutea TaxID=3075823 RepID=A0AA97ELP0_9FLAO|nr:hypothetical protein [Hwangdonia sp. SCSIO 19198]WOD42830.1 hypothetical protein RNZ46_12605 [Hwangdonia sp. SCSIO 19198]